MEKYFPKEGPEAFRFGTRKAEILGVFVGRIPRRGVCLNHSMINLPVFHESTAMVKEYYLNLAWCIDSCSKLDLPLQQKSRVLA